MLCKLHLLPLKEHFLVTIPNSGLQAAVLAVRLKCTILEETNFDIHEIGFWIVLKINLSYI